MPNYKIRKAINFDLDTKLMDKEFGYKKHPLGYSKVKRFMLSNGFEHRQGSGYFSRLKMSAEELLAVLVKLREKEPWLIECCKSIYATNIYRETDVTFIFAGAEEDFTQGVDKGNDFSAGNKKPGPVGLAPPIDNGRPKAQPSGSAKKERNKDIER